MDRPVVGVIMGSKSDWEVVRNATRTLEELGIAYEAKVLSAHRTPDQVTEWASTAEQRGLRVIIAAAGMAAALPGAIAAKTVLPVLGVPMEGKIAGGLDALLSMSQMPAGVPVGTLAVGRSGAVNAALLAAAILALSDEGVRSALEAYRRVQMEHVLSESDPAD